MGKKSKQGKARKDKFYFLAKETGYRSRAAFKLIQLNRRFNFLGSSKVLIDLCAAPGGWMQVAAKEMPVNSVIIGVDLMPIMPIPNCKSIVADITTEKCRQLLRAALLHNKADVVLHDGAPNVGTAWTIDEYSQASLCLKSFALATEFLRNGGWFITKVFRSRDYEPLKWAISQFFRKVRVLKPEASRLESAEIFLVCQGYLFPSHIDPKFLDPKHVFGEVEVAKSRDTVVSSLLRRSNKRKKAEGYDDEKLYKETPLSAFMNSDDPLKCLAYSYKISCDRPELLEHPLTPAYIKDSLDDIQVLGKAEIRAILTWRKKILKALEANNKTETEKEEQTTVEADKSSQDEEDIDREVERLLKEEQHENKKRLKIIRKAKRKLAERIVRKMEHPGDQIEQNDAHELFSLSAVGDLDELERLEKKMIQETGHSAADLMVLKEEQAVRKAAKEKIEGDFRRAVEGGEYLQFDRHAEHDVDLGALESTKPENIHDRDDIYLSSSDDDVDIEDDVEDKRSLPDAGEQLVFGSDDEGDLDEEDAEAFESDEDDDVDSINTEKKTLLVDLDPADEETKQKRKISAWCNSSEIKDLLNVEDLDAEADSDTDTFSKKAKKPELVKTPAKEKKVTFADLDVPTSEPSITPTAASSDGKEKKKAEKKQKKLRRPLTAEEKALAVRLVQSAKSRRDLLEWNFHRYRFFEDPSSLPDWFVGDEKKHMRKPLPLSQDEKKSERPVTGKTLKKAEEAKARKKMRLAKRLKKVRKRAENLPDDLTERETWSKIKTMYKNAGLLKKKRRPVHRIVNTKAGSRGQAPPPRGAKIKLVDRRMKSDLRGTMKKTKRGRGGGGKRGKVAGRGRSRGSR